MCLRAGSHVAAIFDLAADDDLPIAVDPRGLPPVWEVWKLPFGLGGVEAYQGQAEVPATVLGSDVLEQRVGEGRDVGLRQRALERARARHDRVAVRGDLLRLPSSAIASQSIRQRHMGLGLLGRLGDAAPQPSKVRRGWGRG